MNTIVDLRTARARGERPSAPGANLVNANLRHADLWNANLRHADLRGANLQIADLRDSDLTGALLRNADLRGANLRGADLRNANLTGANLRGADLREANLWGANLREVGIVGLGETPSGGALIFPTPDGWTMQVGGWRGSPDDLRALIAKDDAWPVATGDEIARRRPYLEAVLTHVDLITTDKADLIAELAEKWKSA